LNVIENRALLKISTTIRKVKAYHHQSLKLLKKNNYFKNNNNSSKIKEEANMITKMNKKKKKVINRTMMKMVLLQQMRMDTEMKLEKMVKDLLMNMAMKSLKKRLKLI
jgi:hypothetical protein